MVVFNNNCPCRETEFKSAKPGTQEFRDAPLKAIESEKEIAASHGVYNFTPTDHAGLDERGRVCSPSRTATGRL
jgi:hypothetical protein